jgi:MFS family permease
MLGLRERQTAPGSTKPARSGGTAPDGPPVDRRSEAGLDWLNFFTANLQTAFGPFVSVYLTQRAWTQSDIGMVLSVGYAASMISQVPAGALVDATRQKTRAAGAAILAIIAGALMLAFFPTLLPVMAAEVSHGFASCMLGPAIAAISLALAGRAAGAAGLRLGRNARYASIGNGVAAGLMAVVGSTLGARAVFILGAGMAVPGLFALRLIRTAAPADAPRTAAAGPPQPAREGIFRLLADRRLLWFALCCAAFTLSNAYMLPLAASEATASLGNDASLLIGACIVGPQIIVALLSPAAGRVAEQRGRRPVLIAGMVALPVRGLALALISGHPGWATWALIPVQLLDGISGAAFGVLVPLVTSDITRGTGRFNLCMGVIGLAMGAAAAASTFAGGMVADQSPPLAFLVLAGIGGLGVVLAAVMPETR